MKRLNYTLEKTAQGWVIKSEDGKDQSKEFKNRKEFVEILEELLMEDKILPSSAKALIKQIMTDEDMPVVDESISGFDAIISATELAGTVVMMDRRLKWPVLFENEIAPAFVTCTCGGHARIKMDDETAIGEFISKEEAKRYIPEMLKKKQIDDAGGHKLLEEINNSKLPETDEDAAQNADASISFTELFSGALMVEIKV